MRFIVKKNYSLSRAFPSNAIERSYCPLLFFTEAREGRFCCSPECTAKVKIKLRATPTTASPEAALYPQYPVTHPPRVAPNMFAKEEVAW
jgi:hypothetical protein